VWNCAKNKEMFFLWKFLQVEKIQVHFACLKFSFSEDFVTQKKGYKICNEILSKSDQITYQLSNIKTLTRIPDANLRSCVKNGCRSAWHSLPTTTKQIVRGGLTLKIWFVDLM
jgi:hypothetical protein